MAKGQSTVLTDNGKPVAAKIDAFPAFGDVELSRPDTLAVYDNRGGKSCKAALFTIAFNTPIGSVIAKGSVYGRLKDDGSVKFNATLPKELSLRGDMKDAFDLHTATAIMNWSGRNRAWDEAHKALTAAPKAKGSKAAKLDDALTFVPVVKSKDGETESETETGSTVPETQGETATS